MTKQKKDELISDINSELKDLDNLFTDKIVELNKVQGGQDTRHAMMYYRSKVWEISKLLKQLTFKNDL